MVIIGHCYTDELPLFLIFSFLMPLFFILSAATFKTSKNNEEFVSKTEKAFKHLIVPYIVMFCYSVVWKLAHSYTDIFSSKKTLKDFLSDYVLKFVFASGMPVEVKESVVPLIGVTWFFVVLFISRTIYDYAHLKLDKQWKLVVFCLVSCVAGVAVSHIQWLPFSLDICFAILPFILFGQNLLRIEPEKKWGWKLILSGIIWFGLWMLTGKPLLNLAGRNYSPFPLIFITAISGTVMICEFSVGLCKLEKVITPLTYLGKNSLYMMCVHNLDYSLFKNLWNFSDVLVIRIIMRVVVDIAFFSAFMAIRSFAMKKIKKSER